MMLPKQTDRLIHNAMKSIVNPHQQTRYAIKNTIGDVWLDALGHWHGLDRALRFEFMTTALAYAIDKNLDLSTFTVETV